MTCTAIEKKFIPTDCPDCGAIVMSNDFFCDKCAQSRADEHELDQEMREKDEELTPYETGDISGDPGIKEAAK